MEEPTILTELVDVGQARAALVSLNRPDTLNAISWQMINELEEALRTIDADDSVCAVLITGEGRAFSAGGDLKAYVDLQKDPYEFPRFSSDLHRTFASISQMRVPVVALVNGVTAAGGLELLLSCDFAYAAASARVGDLHLKFGQMGGGGVLSLLPRSIGPARARELVFSARLLEAAEAEQWGLVNRVVPDDELIEAGLELARGIAARSASALAVAKDVLNSAFAEGTGLHGALRLEREATVRYCLTLPDAHEGLVAFSERREPRFERGAGKEKPQ